MVQKRMGYFLSMWLLAALLVACGPTSSLTPQAEPCVPIDSISNPYLATPDVWLWGIYDHSGLPAGSNGSLQHLEARYAAYKILGRQVKRWSSFVDIDLPDSGKVRITVTYLSPQLLGTIELNQMLLRGSGPFAQADFPNKIKEGMANIAKRNETLFLVTITSARYGSGTSDGSVITLDFPLPEMGLTNSSNTTVYPLHDDHSLDQYNRLINGSFSGFVSYQLTAKNGESCSLMLDPLWDTTISIHVPGLKMNNSDQEQQTWTIRYMPPIDDGNPDEIPNYVLLNPMPDFNLYTPLESAPNPDPVSDEYWENMGRYIWEQVMFASSP